MTKSQLREIVRRNLSNVCPLFPKPVFEAAPRYTGHTYVLPCIGYRIGRVGGGYRRRGRIPTDRDAFAFAHEG